MLNRKLQKEILEMVKKDQIMRRGSRYNHAVDLQNTKRLKKIIGRYGWPLISMVGESGARGSWLVAQHADHDVSFQKRCLRLLTSAVQKGQADKKYVAYLTDRVLFNEKKPQLFGTQFVLNNIGRMEPWKIKYPKRVDSRRRAFGLDSFSKYRKQLLRVVKKLG